MFDIPQPPVNFPLYNTQYPKYLNNLFQLYKRNLQPAYITRPSDPGRFSPLSTWPAFFRKINVKTLESLIIVFTAFPRKTLQLIAVLSLSLYQRVWSCEVPPRWIPLILLRPKSILLNGTTAWHSYFNVEPPLKGWMNFKRPFCGNWMSLKGDKLF